MTGAAGRLHVVATVWDRDPQPDAAALARSRVSRQLARTETSAPPGQAGQRQVPDVVFDRRPVKDLLTHLGGDPEGAMEYFYARLFADNPDLRAMFPYSMTQTRAAVFGMPAPLIRGPDETQGAAAAA